MNKTKCCLDCLHCKVVNKHRQLACKAGMWIKENSGDQWLIRLHTSEIRSLDIRVREIFNTANRCGNFVNVG